MDARPADYRPAPSKKGGEVIEYRDKLGRRRFRNARRRCSEMRKVVPKRKDAWDLSTPEGLLKQHAYRTDTTRQELADALKISIRILDKIIAHPTAKNKTKINRHHIHVMSEYMGLTQEQRDKIYVAYNQGQTGRRQRVLGPQADKQSPRRDSRPVHEETHAQGREARG